MTRSGVTHLFVADEWRITLSLIRPTGLSGSSLSGLSITEIPLGYGIFCSTYDFTVACYLMISDTAWHVPGKFDLYFWRRP